MPHGDFTLNPFLYRNDVSRVLWQQGRVQLDSDANEQTEAILRAVRAGLRDIIGPHGGYAGSFRITLDTAPLAGDRIRIGRGHYYVDGIRCWNGEDRTGLRLVEVFREFDFNGVFVDTGSLLHEQANYPRIDANKHFDRTKQELVYLDVWERHISAAEDDSIREVALQGPDTASRAVIVWQVRVLDPGDSQIPIETAYTWLRSRFTPLGTLRARAVVNEDDQACIISPEARYRGPENRLYRVEIHEIVNDETWIKWSPDNASIVYPVREVQGRIITLDALGRDDRTAITIGDWVELVDEDVALSTATAAPPLVQVVGVDRARMQVTVRENPLNGTLDLINPRRVILRRWATKPQKLTLAGNPPTTPWLPLSDGVSVQLSAPMDRLQFRVADYWLIPSRTATGDVIWPKNATNEPEMLPPHGVKHYYAPLAQWNGQEFVDLRRTYVPLTGMSG